MFKKNEIYNFDYVLVLAAVGAVFIGILMIYSSGFDPIDKINSGLYKKQLLWFIISFIIMLALTVINYKWLGDYCVYIYLGLLFLLLITTLFGKNIRNTRAWLSFGFFSIQTSEFMKLGVIIILAKYLEIRDREIEHFRELLVPALLCAIPVGLIVLQPDFGTALMFIPILFTLLFIGGADVTHLVSIVGIACLGLFVPIIITYSEWMGAENVNLLIAFFKNLNLLLVISVVLLVAAVTTFILSFFFVKKLYRKIYIPSTVFSLGLFFSVLVQKYLKDYQKKRIMVFLNPDLDPHGSGYNVIQSKIAVGSGGLFGKGFLKGSQSQLGYLPEKSSDFIFSVVAEEWGFIGSVILLICLGVIVFRGIQIAIEAKDKFGALLASGITAFFFFHILVNVGMGIGIIPVTGLPLVFVSYGGSNLLVSMIGVGLLINIRMRKSVY